MEKMRFGLTFCLFLIVLLVIVGAIGIVSGQQVPDYKDKYVNDFANVLSASQYGWLRSLFYSVDMNTTAEVVFVSLDTINGEDISQYSLAIADSWKVGKADKDNGLVILYVKDIGKIWVSTGYGLEGILPDSKAGRLLDENYVPLRDSGNFSEGIVLFSNAVTQVIYDNKEEVLSGQAGGSAGRAQSGNSSFWVYFIWFVIFVGGEFLYVLLAPTKSWWLGGVLGGCFGLFFGFFFISSILWTIILVVFGAGIGTLFDYIVSKKYVPGKSKSSSGWRFLPIFLPSGRSFGGGGGGGGGGGFGGGGFGGGGAGR
jgi:uncharacterized protein